jgi:hypothetical protein
MPRTGGKPEQLEAARHQKRGPSIGRLDSVGRCAIEAARLYRHARRKQIETIEAHPGDYVKAPLAL